MSHEWWGAAGWVGWEGVGGNNVRVQVAQLLNAFSRHGHSITRSCYVHGSCYVARKKVDTNQQRLEAQNTTRVHNFIFWNLISGSDFGVVVLSSLHVCGPVIGPPGSL